MTNNEKEPSKKIDKKNLINPEFQEHGYIQVYTGDGKGKTTASLGLAVRAIGRGWKVLIVMFTKGGNDYGELNTFTNLLPELKSNLTVCQAGLDRIVYKKNISQADYTETKKGWELAKQAILSGKYQMVIMDEANIAIDLGLIDLDDVVKTLKNKPEKVEVVLTGRRAKKEIIEIAHLVSEIKPVKHYWNIGIQAREGIEY